jgi:hypothetical protein
MNPELILGLACIVFGTFILKNTVWVTIKMAYTEIQKKKATN